MTYIVYYVHYDILKFWQQKKKHNFKNCVLFLVLNYYVFRHCRHLQGAKHQYFIQTYNNKYCTLTSQQIMFIAKIFIRCNEILV